MSNADGGKEADCCYISKLSKMITVVVLRGYERRMPEVGWVVIRIFRRKVVTQVPESGGPDCSVFRGTKLHCLLQRRVATQTQAK